METRGFRDPADFGHRSKYDLEHLFRKVYAYFVVVTKVCAMLCRAIRCTVSLRSSPKTVHTFSPVISPSPILHCCLSVYFSFWNNVPVLFVYQRLSISLVSLLLLPRCFTPSPFFCTSRVCFDFNSNYHNKIEGSCTRVVSCVCSLALMYSSVSRCIPLFLSVSLYIMSLSLFI